MPTRMKCNKCDNELVFECRLLFANNMVHLMARCSKHGAIYVPKTAENVRAFENLPLKESKPVRRMKQRSIYLPLESVEGTKFSNPKYRP